MAIIEQIEVRFKVATLQFQRGVQRATNKLRDFEKQANKLGPAGAKLANSARAMASNLAGIHPAAVAAGAGLGALALGMREVTEQMQELDKLAKAARLAGVSANELLGFRQLGAEAGGLEPQVVDKAITRLRKQIAQAAAEPSSEQAKIFQGLLGLDPKNLSRMQGREMIKALAESFQGVEDAGNRARVAEAAFGEEANKLALALLMSADAIDKVFEDSKRRAGAISDVELAAIETANDQMARLGLSWKGFWQQFTLALAPALKNLTSLVNKLEELFGFAPQLGRLAYNLSSFGTFGRILAPGGGGSGPSEAETEEQRKQAVAQAAKTKELLGILEQEKKQREEAAETSKRLEAEGKRQVDALNRERKRILDATKAFGKSAEQLEIERVEAAMESLAISSEEGAARIAQLRGVIAEREAQERQRELDERKRKAEELADAMERERDARRDAAAAAEEASRSERERLFGIFRPAMTEFRKTMSDLDGAVFTGVITAEEWSKGVEEARKKLEEARAGPEMTARGAGAADARTAAGFRQIVAPGDKIAGYLRQGNGILQAIAEEIARQAEAGPKVATP